MSMFIVKLKPCYRQHVVVFSDKLKALNYRTELEAEHKDSTVFKEV